jgi:hypothetical protein
MADEEQKKEQVTEEEAAQLIKDSEEDPAAVATAEAEPEADPEGDKKGDEAAEEFELVRETGDSQPQKQSHFGIRKRINKLNARNAEANERTEVANQENAVLAEKNKILEIALQQARENNTVSSPPNPSDFEDGTSDPKFQEKQNVYNQEVIQREVNKQVQASSKTVSDNDNLGLKAHELEKKQLKHYERAVEIGAKDYSETEDKAIEILGNENVNHIIDNFPDSQFLLYYLGKNPQEAERISLLIRDRPIQGVAEIGRLSSELKVKTKTVTTPNPDVEIEGGEPGGNANSTLLKQLDKLRDNAGKNPTQANMKKIMDFRKKLQEKGIKLE